MEDFNLDKTKARYYYYDSMETGNREGPYGMTTLSHKKYMYKYYTITYTH